MGGRNPGASVGAAADLLLTGERELHKAAARKKLLPALVRIYADAGVALSDERGSG